MDQPFNGDLAQPASSELLTDVSCPAVRNRNHGVVESEGSSEVACSISLQFRGGH